MSVIGLVNQAVAWYAASAVLAFLFAMRKPLSGAIAGIGGAVASAMLVVAGGAALLGVVAYLFILGDVKRIELSQ
jgi:formate hydrogenlyase subunit 3